MDEGISDKTSQRICSHMNDDHAVSVHAMVKNALPYAEQLLSIKDAQMTSISLTGYNLSFVVCNGDLCSRRSITIDFVPPLSSGKECRYVQFILALSLWQCFQFDILESLFGNNNK